MINASREELLLSNDDPDQSIELVNGGYLAALGVYHELHCIVRFLHFFFSSFSFWENCPVPLINENE